MDTLIKKLHCMFINSFSVDVVHSMSAWDDAAWLISII